MGNSFGAQRSIDKARQAEMEKLGLTPDMLEAAREIGVTLENSMQGLQASQDSLRTLQNLARSLEESDNTLYQKAQKSLQNDDEEEARKYLLERTGVQEKLVKTLKSCAEERVRLDQMESNVQALQDRAQEIERLLSRSVGAKALQDSSLRLQQEDPLLQKFRDAGIE